MKKEEQAALITNETNKRLATMFANIVDEKITQVENASSSTYKESLHTAISSASKDAITKFEEEQKRKGRSFDVAAVKDFKDQIDGKVEGMLKDVKDFSGKKSQADQSQITTLRKKLDNYRADNEIAPSAKSTTVEPKKLSSLDTWNLLVDEVSKTSKLKLNRVEEWTNKNIPKNEKIDNDLGQTMRSNFESTLSADIKNKLNDKEFTKDLDPKTAEAFRQNINTYVNKMLVNTPDFSGDEKDFEKKFQNIRDEADKFKKGATIDPKAIETSWAKAENVFKSVGIKPLADFCHDRHLEAISKKIGKELDSNIATHPLKSLADSNLRFNKPLASKQKGTDHGM